MARTDPQLNIRCPQELRDKLEQAANGKKRSLTAEVVMRLEQSFDANSAINDNEKLHQEIKTMSDDINALMKQFSDYRNSTV